VNYLVYTDGSASVKDRTGGYAWKVIVAGGQFIGGGSELDTTISRMELMAAIGALEFIIREVDSGLQYPTVALVISDSEHVVLGFMDKNRARNKNRDLWDRLEKAAGCFDLVHFEHVKGHAGHVDNEAVDVLAGEFRQAAVESLK
jgi:ribonuclease HI